MHENAYILHDFYATRPDLIFIQSKLAVRAKTLQLIGPRQELEVGCVAIHRKKKEKKKKRVVIK